ncbi:hypothetical protein EDB86DRAFT_3241530 [Lactarius hatsudake]|nr:hypothetical protein EDB86DRAFT_3241530 [Lactarius hatsudake]
MALVLISAASPACPVQVVSHGAYRDSWYWKGRIPNPSSHLVKELVSHTRSVVKGVAVPHDVSPATTPPSDHTSDFREAEGTLKCTAVTVRWILFEMSLAIGMPRSLHLSLHTHWYGYSIKTGRNILHFPGNGYTSPWSASRRNVEVELQLAFCSLIGWSLRDPDTVTNLPVVLTDGKGELRPVPYGACFST